MRVTLFAAFLLVLIAFSCAAPAPLTQDIRPDQWDEAAAVHPDESIRHDDQGEENAATMETSKKLLENDVPASDDESHGETSDKLLSEESIAETAGIQEQDSGIEELADSDPTNRQLESQASSIEDEKMTDIEEDVDTSDKQLESQGSMSEEHQNSAADSSEKLLETQETFEEHARLSEHDSDEGLTSEMAADDDTHSSLEDHAQMSQDDAEKLLESQSGSEEGAESILEDHAHMAESDSDKLLESETATDDGTESVLEATDKQFENQQHSVDITADVADMSGESTAASQTEEESGVASDVYVPDEDRTAIINGQQIVAHATSIDGVSGETQTAANEEPSFTENVEQDEVSSENISVENPDHGVSSEDEAAEKQVDASEDDSEGIIDGSVERVQSSVDGENIIASGQEGTTSEDELHEGEDDFDTGDTSHMEEQPKTETDDITPVSFDADSTGEINSHSEGSVQESTEITGSSEDSAALAEDDASLHDAAGISSGVSEHSASGAEAPSGGIVSQSEEDEPQHIDSSTVLQEESSENEASGHDGDTSSGENDDIGADHAEDNGLGVFASYAEDRKTSTEEEAVSHAGIRAVEKTEEDPAQLEEEEAERKRALVGDSGHVSRNPPQHLYTGHTYRPPQHGNSTTPSTTSNVVVEQLHHHNSINADRKAPPSATTFTATDEDKNAATKEEEPFVQDVIAPGEEEEEEQQQTAPASGGDHAQPPPQEHSAPELNIIRARRMASMEPEMKGSQLFQFLFALAVFVVAVRIGYSWFTMDKNRRIFLRKLRAPTERDVEV